MDERRWEQVAAATGIAFVVVLLIGTFIVDQPPDVDGPAREIRRYFLDNQNGLLFQAWLFGLAGVLFIWFAGTLRSRLAVAEGEGRRLSLISFAGAIGTLATLVPTVALNATLAYTVARGAPPVLTHALFELSFWFGVLVVFSLAVFVGAASLSAGRTGALPQWLAWGGLAVAALHLLQSVDLFVRNTDFFEPNGVIGYVNLVLILLWILAASVLMLQSVRGTARSRNR
ncbi:MAG TPA: hypothetical protein VHI54_11845 [Actinomycetota bacterium]|nr:hypothetical protein [Actinomycetota bacterium]